MARLVEQMIPDKGSRAQGAAGIAGGGLNPDVFERTFAKKAAIGDAIEGDSAGEDEVFHFRLPMHFASHAQYDFFGDLLNAGSEVHVALLEHGFRRAGWAAEQIVKSAIGHGQALAIIEVIHVHPEAAVRFQTEEVLE